MNFKKPLLLTLVSSTLMSASFLIAANELPYTYVEGAYTQESGSDTDADGFNLGGSYQLNENFILLFDYDYEDFSDGAATQESAVYSLGGAYRFPIAAKTDFVSSLVYQNYGIDTKVPGFSVPSVDGDGFTLATGVRSLVQDKLELSGNILYTKVDFSVDGSDLGGDEEDMGLELAAHYEVVDNLWLGYSFQTYDDADADSHSLNVRFSF